MAEPREETVAGRGCSHVRIRKVRRCSDLAHQSSVVSSASNGKFRDIDARKHRPDLKISRGRRGNQAATRGAPHCHTLP